MSLENKAEEYQLAELWREYREQIPKAQAQITTLYEKVTAIKNHAQYDALASTEEKADIDETITQIESYIASTTPDSGTE